MAGHKFKAMQISKNDTSKLDLYDYIVACIAALIIVPIVSFAGMVITHAIIDASNVDGTDFIAPVFFVYLFQYFVAGTFSFILAWVFIILSVIIFPYILKKFGHGFHVQIVCATFLILPYIIYNTNDNIGQIYQEGYEPQYFQNFISQVPFIFVAYTYSTLVWFLCKWRKPAAFRK